MGSSRWEDRSWKPGEVGQTFRIERRIDLYNKKLLPCEKAASPSGGAIFPRTFARLAAMLLQLKAVARREPLFNFEPAENAMNFSLQ